MKISNNNPESELGGDLNHPSSRSYHYQFHLKQTNLIIIIIKILLVNYLNKLTYKQYGTYQNIPIYIIEVSENLPITCTDFSYETSMTFKKNWQLKWLLCCDKISSN